MILFSGFEVKVLDEEQTRLAAAEGWDQRPNWEAEMEALEAVDGAEDPTASASTADSALPVTTRSNV